MLTHYEIDERQPDEYASLVLAMAADDLPTDLTEEHAEAILAAAGKTLDDLSRDVMSYSAELAKCAFNEAAIDLRLRHAGEQAQLLHEAKALLGRHS